MTALARNSALDNIDPRRFLIVERQLTAKNSESNQNRSQLQRLQEAKADLQHRRSLLMGQPKVSTKEVEDLDTQFKEIDDYRSSLNSRYHEISEELKPIILLRNNSKDFLLSNGIQLPGELGMGAPFATTVSKRSEYDGKIVPLKANGSGKRSADPVQAYSNLKDNHQAIKREKRKVEDQPTHGAEIAPKWEAIIDREAEIGRASSPCVYDPESRDVDRNIIPDFVADETTGRVNLGALTSLLCAIFPDQIKQFIRSVNAPMPGTIGSEQRKAKLKALDEEQIAVQWELEKAARVIEALGMQVTRPGDLDPRIFLAREV